MVKVSIKSLWLLFLILFQLEAMAAGLNLYLSPTGNDTFDGLTSAKAVLTLKRAHQLVAAHLKKSPSEVNVLVAPGVYYNQSIVWTATHPSVQVRIKSTKPASKPVFDGRASASETLGNQRSFFILRSSAGASNLTIENLLVRYYAEAISLSGDREDAKAGFNSQNKILHSVFDRIGSKFHKDKAAHAYAVVRLVNSRMNDIKGNRFTNIANASRPELLHSLYIASFSHSNVIEGNYFGPQPGDPLRVRDYSNFNLVTKNEFSSAGPYVYSEWYCEKAESSECSKVIPECPSWGSSVRSNIYRGSGLFHLYVRPSFVQASSACKTKAPAEAAGKRLSTGSNVQTSEAVVHSVLNNVNYYGICPNANYCVNASSKCYADGKGSSQLLCSSKKWYSCSKDLEVGRKYSGKTCTKSGTTFAWK